MCVYVCVCVCVCVCVFRSSWVTFIVVLMRFVYPNSYTEQGRFNLLML